MSNSEQPLPQDTLSLGDPDQTRTRRGRIRLAISIPALLVLFVLAFGLVSRQLFEAREGELQRLGAQGITGELLRWHLYTMLILCGFAFATGLGLAYAILRPIFELQKTAHRLMDTGEFNFRAPTLLASPELGDLSRSFNSMMDFVNDSIQVRNRYLIEGIVTGIITTDHHGRITAINRTGAQILGMNPNEAVGRSVKELRDSLPSKFHPLWNYLEASLHEEQRHAPREIVLNTTREKESLLASVSTLKDSRGRLGGAMLNFRDAGEIRHLYAQLSKTDQLAALGTFSMGLAHELRNPLSAIKGMTQLLATERNKPEGSEAEYLNRIVQEVNRLDRFVSELLDFSNTTSTPPAPTNIETVLRAATPILSSLPRELREKEIKIVEEFTATPPILAEPDRLARAFGNLIRNALESAAPHSRVTLKTFVRREVDGDWVCATVHNTGSTIEEALRPKVFMPFFTTKERGTGLGLAIAHQIVTQQNGRVELETGADEVAFTVRFKAVRDGLAPTIAPAQ